MIIEQVQKINQGQSVDELQSDKVTVEFSGVEIDREVGYGVKDNGELGHEVLSGGKLRHEVEGDGEPK